ncbi:Aste57867_8014 [Aphanomyces stellatus]|uniref:Aste57867_8014 protein n=1 Tax=Aphanomyces stellatus TaxID=120398 RepID=A0A485KJ82_9STRA|nr:hypothetical protein As57867_007984 [Aphanomyces stellatus]VFT84907.1 Aste57867_8014 [Aphanomyces stellatus]
MAAVAQSAAVACFSAPQFTGAAVSLSAGLNVSNVSSWGLCSLRALYVPRGMALIGFPLTSFLGVAVRWDRDTSTVDAGTIESFVVIDRADDVHLLMDINDNSTVPWVLPLSTSNMPSVINAVYDMSISSVHLPPGIALVGYKRRYFLGPFRVWTGSLVTLGEWNNRIRSFQILPTAAAPPAPAPPAPSVPRVTLFAQPSFDVAALVEYAGDMVASVDDWGFNAGNNSLIQSVVVPPGLVYIEYAGVNFQPPFRAWQTSMATLPRGFFMHSYKIVTLNEWTIAGATALNDSFVACIEPKDTYLLESDLLPRLDFVPTLTFQVPVKWTVTGFSGPNMTGAATPFPPNSIVHVDTTSFRSLALHPVPLVDTPSLVHRWALWLALGGLALVTLVAIVVWRRHRQHRPGQSFVDHPPLSSVGMDTPLDTAAIDWGDVDLVRLDSTQLQRLAFVASGGSGNVYHGVFRGTTHVAIKVLHVYTLDSVQRLVREISLLASIRCPFVVGLVGAVWSQPTTDLAAVLEWMAGGDLHQLLAATPRTAALWPTKLQWARHIAEALFYIHSMALLHRDLKSRNVLLTADTYTAKVGDLGTATDRDADATRTAAVGTYRWMAPEMLAFEPYSNAVDVYAFGVVLSEMDTHRSPYSEHIQGGNEGAIVGRVLHDHLRPSFEPDCPVWFRFLALRCMSHEPAERPTAAEILHVLLTHLRRE